MGDTINSLFNFFLGSDVPATDLSLGQVAARATVVYCVGVALVRIGKSRLISSMSSIDILLAVVLGSLLSRGINGSASISSSLVAASVLIAVHWLVTEAAMRSHWFGNLIKGRVRLLVDRGEIDWSAMRRSHISEHDLLEELRLNANVEDLDRIERAYKERNGRVSGIRRNPAASVVEITTEEGVKTVRIEMLSGS